MKSLNIHHLEQRAESTPDKLRERNLEQNYTSGTLYS